MKSQLKAIDKKTCTSCKEEKSLSEFSKDQSRKGGYYFKCLKCTSIYNRAYYKKGSSKILKQRRTYYKKHNSRFKATVLKWRDANREGVREYARAYYPAYYKKHIEKFRARARDTYHRLMKTDIQFRLRMVLRARIYGVLIKGVKSAPTMELVGCNINQLIQHLERQFWPGMNWDNHGRTGWHVDHIRPCNSFNLLDPIEQSICFHFSNLQPLWAKDNLAKGAKLTETMNL